MDPVLLEIFLKVAEERSVTRAAAQLGRAASSVTTRLQQLEGFLNSVLFSREGKRMTLTRQGELFHPYARRLLALAAEARLALQHEPTSKILKLGTMESTTASRLPPILAEFGRALPGVSLRLSLGASQDLAKAVVVGELDCALVARPPDQPRWLQSFGVNDYDLEITPIYQEDLLLVLPAGHPPVRGRSDIKMATLAALEPGCTYRRAAERWMRYDREVQTLEVSSYHSILAHVVSGAAVGVMPRSVLENLKWTSEVAVHSVGIIDTLLISRRDHNSGPMRRLRAILSAAKDVGLHPGLAH